jgi:hypothetical protein
MPSPLHISCTLALLAPLGFGQQNSPNYDESAIPPYTLPELLKTKSGLTVQTSGQWEKERRAEVLELFEQHVFGRTPRPDIWGKPTFETISVKKDALNGKAVRKLVRITLPKFPKWQGIEMMLHTPAKAKGPVPCFVGISFGGNQCVSADPDVPISTRWMRPSKEGYVQDNRATEASRGTERERWQLELAMDAGFGVATYYYGDVEPDHTDGWKDGLRAAISPQGASTEWKDGDWGAIGAWAWGASRIADYLETDSSVDASKLAVIGHSRLGKTSLWAGAQDKRFGVVISNNSGEGGAALMRRNIGETTAIITKAFPHWFTTTYRSYANNESACPTDKHMLIALIAPRAAYIASAEEDKWADPKGEFLSGLHCQPVYDLYSKKGYGVKEQPPLNSPVGDFVAYHIRSGKHDVIRYDWEQYLPFARRHLLK